LPRLVARDPRAALSQCANRLWARKYAVGRIASVFSAMEVCPVRTTRISAGTIAPAEVEISCGPEPLEHERDECFAGGRRARPALEVRAPGL
jgi:hypothetical protein